MSKFGIYYLEDRIEDLKAAVKKEKLKIKEEPPFCLAQEYRKEISDLEFEIGELEIDIERLRAAL